MLPAPVTLWMVVIISVTFRSMPVGVWSGVYDVVWKILWWISSFIVFLSAIRDAGGLFGVFVFCVFSASAKESFAELVSCSLFSHLSATFRSSIFAFSRSGKCGWMFGALLGSPRFEFSLFSFYFSFKIFVSSSGNTLCEVFLRFFDILFCFI